ncbi:MAG: isochorismatase family protein [Pikeienuella sp.]
MKTALLVIDVQMAFVHDDAEGAERSCPEAYDNIAGLLAEFRQRGDKVVHIHHHGLDEADPFHVDAPGAVVQPFAAPVDGEEIVIKHVASAFTATSLEADLRAAGVERLVICGATANHCAESTARAAGNLGFDTYYASDAVWAYGATGPDGVAHSAEQIHSVTLANLHGEFATVMPAVEIMAL